MFTRDEWRHVAAFAGVSALCVGIIVSQHLRGGEPHPALADSSGSFVVAAPLTGQANAAAGNDVAPLPHGAVLTEALVSASAAETLARAALKKSTHSVTPSGSSAPATGSPRAGSAPAPGKTGHAHAPTPRKAAKHALKQAKHDQKWAQKWVQKWAQQQGEQQGGHDESKAEHQAKKDLKHQGRAHH